jgi:hypothetical protein
VHEKTPFQWTGLAGKLGAVVALCLLPDPYWFDGAAHAARSGTNKSNGRLMFRGITNVSVRARAELLVAVRARVSGVGDQRRAPAPNNRLG